MTRFMIVVLTVLGLLGATSAQNADVSVHFQTAGPLIYAEVTVTGPPMSQMELYYSFNGLQGPIGLLAAANLGTLGRWQLTVPLQGNFVVPHIWFGGFVIPPAGVPMFTGLAAAAVAAGGAVVAPCVRNGGMSWDPDTCTVILSAKVCPGDTVTIKKNGIPVISGVAGANGEIILASGGVCLAPGDTLTAEVNGAPWLGPITR